MTNFLSEPWKCILTMAPYSGCPLCQCEQDDEWQFLECAQHKDCTALFTELKSNLTKMMEVSIQCLFTAIWLGLTIICADAPYPDILQEVPLPLQTPILQWTWLGWDQIYQGQVAADWAEDINKLLPPMLMNGKQVMIQIMKHIWMYILDTWKFCNHHLHNNAAQLNLVNYNHTLWTTPPTWPIAPTNNH